MKHLLTLSALLALTLESIAQYEYYDSSDDIYNLVVETEVVVLDNCVAAELNAGEVFVHRFYVEAESADDQLRAVFGEDQEDIDLPFSISAPGGILNHPEGAWCYHASDPQLLQSFPCLEYDSFATIGFNQVQIVASNDEVTNFFELNTAGQSAELAINGGDEFFAWFTFEDYPDESGRWQILQVTSLEHVNGILNYLILNEDFGNSNGELIVTKHFDTQPLCSDESACNFVADAFNGEGVCDYSCCPGPGCCGLGTTWNWQTSECDVTIPSDSNFDGCVQLNDLLDLLGAYGDCGDEESPWQCGDPLEYQGYDYETVQIGEQCWFAENLRADQFRNGDIIPSGLSDGQWTLAEGPAMAWYGEASASCENFVPEFDACNGIPSNYNFGGLYNGYVVTDARPVCPSGWSTPSMSDFYTLLDNYEDAYQAADALKAQSTWSSEGNGSNASGFRGFASGFRRGLGTAISESGFYDRAGVYGNFWSDDFVNEESFLVYAISLTPQLGVELLDDSQWPPVPGGFGFSIRCIKDAE